ncbi:MAG: 4Fe-4S binding protein, partial [Clostridia bacterium]|nr:4Fe-4S binding protein [Clostridia bacterium]
MPFKLQKRVFILLRYSLLAGLLIFLSYQFYAHAMGDKLFPSVHGLCPFGGLESLLSFVTAGAMIKKIFSGTMVLFFVFLLLSLVFNRAFCGLICSFGAIQEFIGNLGRRVFRRRLLVPQSADRILRYGKYLVLILTVAMAWLTGTLWFAAFDPWTAYGHLISFEELLTSYWIGLIILILSIVGSFFYERFFCKYLCPLGALNAVIGRLSRFSVRRDPEACIDCSLCSRACPVNLDVEHANSIRSAECLSCGKCVAACPREGALGFTFFRRKTGLILVFLLPVILYFGGIWIAQSFGYDRYSGKTEANLRELAD